jgi:hypothetical protein
MAQCSSNTVLTRRIDAIAKDGDEGGGRLKVKGLGFPREVIYSTVRFHHDLSGHSTNEKAFAFPFE